MNVKNDWSREIRIRITKAKRAAFALSKFLKSKCFSKKTKARLYTMIIRPALTCGCKAWTITSNTGRRLRTFENRIWKPICGPVYENRTLLWKIKANYDYRNSWDWH